MMPLNFPNPIRRYDIKRSCIAFWGSDASLEISFEIDFDALRKLRPGLGMQEADLLDAFDDNRASVLGAATASYARHRRSYHRLTPASF